MNSWFARVKDHSCDEFSHVSLEIGIIQAFVSVIKTRRHGATIGGHRGQLEVGEFTPFFTVFILIGHCYIHRKCQNPNMSNTPFSLFIEIQTPSHLHQQ